MTLLFKYIFKRFFLTSITLALLLVGILWLAQSLRYMDFIINNQVSIGSFFTLVGYLLPDLFVIISPIAFAIAMLFCFHKLMITHELSAFRAIGMSNFKLAIPVLTLASALFALLLCMNTFIVPAAFQKFRDQQHLFQNALSSMLLREGSFNTAKSFTVFIKEHTPEDELKGVFIFQPAKSDQPAYTTLAEMGHVYISGHRLLLLLKKGQRQEYNPTTRTYAYFSFDEFVYDLTDEIASKTKKAEKASEKSLTQLLYPDETIAEDVKRRYKVEAHQRILLPFLCLLDALIVSCILLTGEVGRRYDRKKIVGAALSILGIHIIVMALINSSVNYSPCLAIVYAFVFIGIFCSLLYLCRDILFHTFQYRRVT